MSHPPFSKDDMLDELRTIFLFEADHLAMGKGPEAAAAFIGFAADQYHAEDPKRVDLAGFSIILALDAAYDYAFQVGRTDRFSEDQLQDVIVFMEGTPRVGGQGGEGGETHTFMAPEGLCRRTVDTAQGRWWIDHPDEAMELTVRHLALLANMTEGAVRNALAAAGIKATGKRTTVPARFAAQWLADRRGFVPTRMTIDEHALLADLRRAQLPRELAGIIRRRMDAAGLDEHALAERVAWSPSEVSRWCRGEFGVDVEKAKALAEALGFAVPLFVGRTIEAALATAPDVTASGREG